MPSAPAADTAAARRPAPTPAIGAPTTGTSIPNRSVSQVRIAVPLSAARAFRVSHPPRARPSAVPRRSDEHATPAPGARTAGHACQAPRSGP
ncbi:hypothetical protein GCM10018953_74130 [Streptosporangium nondiastaticum]